MTKTSGSEDTPDSAGTSASSTFVLPPTFFKAQPPIFELPKTTPALSATPSASTNNQNTTPSTDNLERGLDGFVGTLTEHVGTIKEISARPLFKFGAGNNMPLAPQRFVFSSSSSSAPLTPISPNNTVPKPEVSKPTTPGLESTNQQTQKFLSASSAGKAAAVTVDVSKTVASPAANPSSTTGEGLSTVIANQPSSSTFTVIKSEPLNAAENPKSSPNGKTKAFFPPSTAKPIATSSPSMTTYMELAATTSNKDKGKGKEVETALSSTTAIPVMGTSGSVGKQEKPNTYPTANWKFTFGSPSTEGRQDPQEQQQGLKVITEIKPPQVPSYLQKVKEHISARQRSGLSAKNACVELVRYFDDAKDALTMSPHFKSGNFDQLVVYVKELYDVERISPQCPAASDAYKSLTQKPLRKDNLIPHMRMVRDVVQKLNLEEKAKCHLLVEWLPVTLRDIALRRNPAKTGYAKFSKAAISNLNQSSTMNAWDNAKSKGKNTGHVQPPASTVQRPEVHEDEERQFTQTDMDAQRLRGYMDALSLKPVYNTQTGRLSFVRTTE